MSDSTDSLKAALKADPSNWEVRYGLIHALHEGGKTDEAVELISEVKELPKDDQSIVYAAQSYHILGAHEQAADVYRAALQVNSLNQAAKAGLESLGMAPVPVQVAPLSVVPLDEDEPPTAVPVESKPTPTLQDKVSPVPVITKEDTVAYDPEIAALVNQIHEAEEESKRRHAASVKRDRLNSIMVTIIVHVILVGLASIVVKKIPRPVPPRLTATSRAEIPDEQNIEQQVLEKPTLQAEKSAEVSALDIISVDAVSSLNFTSLDSVQGLDSPALEAGSFFQPSMSIGSPSDSSSKMMFGQPLEGETLGVILDVSGSMAEWLPFVVRELDRSFKEAPIVYVKSARMEPTSRETEIRPVVADQVIPNYPDRTRTPYWFLWGDLPRKAPQRAVDRLIETFKTRTNQFIALNADGHHHHHGDRLGEAMKFLTKEGCDSIYIFSDFEDFIDEDHALEQGRLLSKAKVRTYIQPAVNGSEFIKVMDRKIASRTKGKQLPPLTSIINPEDDTLKPLVPKPTSKTPTTPQIAGVTYAKPRDTAVSGKFYDYNPSKNWTELGRYEQPEFDAVFYGPEARVFIYLKDNEGKYIQRPIVFGYYSRIYRPEIEDPNRRYQTRKFVRFAEPPKFDGKEIVWKMILEEDLEFDVHLYVNTKGMNATFVAEQLPEKDYSQHSHISFWMPPLAREKNDLYHGFDLPAEGLILEDLRKYSKPNQVVFNLPRQLKDAHESRWNKLGFETGYNTRDYATLIPGYPDGVREVKVSGPSFGPRVFEARTTSTKVHLDTNARSDSEPWEGFGARLFRNKDNIERFTKTEAIGINIE